MILKTAPNMDNAKAFIDFLFSDEAQKLVADAYLLPGRGDDAEYYISSADLMTRNLNRRVEIACPVQDAFLQEKLKWILNSQLRDTAKASLMLPDGSYCRKQSAVPFDSQAYFMQQSPHIPAQPRNETRKLMQWLKRLTERFGHQEA